MASKSLEGRLRVGDRQTLSLTHYGRKSRRPYEVAIWYLVNGDRMYLVSANADALVFSRCEWACRP